MYKITHTGENIDWVNGPDKIGAENVFLDEKDCGDVMAHNDWYNIIMGAIVRKSQAVIDAIELAKKEIKDAAKERVEVIEQAQKTAGGSEYTVPQLDAWLDSEFDPTDFDAAGLAIHQLSDADMSPAARAAIVALAQEIKKIFANTKAVCRKIGVEVLK